MLTRKILTPIWTFVLLLASQVPGNCQLETPVPLEEPPIRYSDTPDNNRVSQWAAKLNSGQSKLEEDPEYGYLPAVLQALEIPVDSQTLVYSKTSLQIRHISPRNPRAIYFNDDTYLGWVRGSSLMELSTADPKLGAAFYLLDATGTRPRIKRAGYDCLGCHATSMTLNVPGHAMRSVMANGDGRVETRHKSFLTELKTPFEQRFGGWYVTGQLGNQKHLGNAFVRGETIDLSRPTNIDRLEYEFDTRRYLKPHSDVIALMVLSHQIELHNKFTKADFQIRKLQHDEESGKLKLLPAERTLLIQKLAESVVETMLFCDEQIWSEPIQGHVDFQKQFAASSQRDSQGRSLRDFDLQTRLFRYPCSYLIYSAAFDDLTLELRQEILRQLGSALHGSADKPSLVHISPETQKAIYEILLETHPEFKKSEVDRVK